MVTYGSKGRATLIDYDLFKRQSLPARHNRRDLCREVGWGCGPGQEPGFVPLASTHDDSIPPLFFYNDIHYTDLDWDDNGMGSVGGVQGGNEASSGGAFEMYQKWRYADIASSNTWGSQNYVRDLSIYRSNWADYAWSNGDYGTWLVNRALANLYNNIADMGGMGGFAFGMLGPGPKGLETPGIGVTRGGLSAEQAGNLGRFERRLPSGAGPTSLYDLPGGGKAFQSEVPGRVPGSSAIYEKQVGAGGETLQFTKTTVDPFGRIVHTKNKLTGDVILPP